MTDLLIKLFDLPPLEPHLARLGQAGIVLRRALLPEKHLVLAWVEATFASAGWRDECAAAFTRQPISCFLATRDGAIAGFFCYEVTMKGLMGPCGVDPAFRRQGIFTALALSAAFAMNAEGYAYAVIPSVSTEAEAALTKGLGAIRIPDTSKNFYDGMLRS